MAKRGVGRPPVFSKGQRKSFAAVVRKHGLTHGREILATEGVSVNLGPGKGSVVKTFKVSLVTLGKIAKEAGVELKPGRPVGSGVKAAA